MTAACVSTCSIACWLDSTCSTTICMARCMSAADMKRVGKPVMRMLVRRVAVLPVLSASSARRRRPTKPLVTAAEVPEQVSGPLLVKFAWRAVQDCWAAAVASFERLMLASGTQYK